MSKRLLAWVRTAGLLTERQQGSFKLLAPRPLSKQLACEAYYGLVFLRKGLLMVGHLVVLTRHAQRAAC